MEGDVSLKSELGLRKGVGLSLGTDKPKDKEKDKEAKSIVESVERKSEREFVVLTVRAYPLCISRRVRVLTRCI